MKAWLRACHCISHIVTAQSLVCQLAGIRRFCADLHGCFAKASPRCSSFWKGCLLEAAAVGWAATCLLCTSATSAADTLADCQGNKERNLPYVSVRHL